MSNPGNKREKTKAYTTLVEKFLRSVGELSMGLSRENRRSRVSKIDVYQALWQSLGERMPTIRVQKHSSKERRKLAAKAYVRNCRTQRELRENIRAALAARLRSAERDCPLAYDPDEDSMMEVDRSSRTVEMRSRGGSSDPSSSAMSLSCAGDRTGSRSSLASRRLDEMSVDLSAGRSRDLADDLSSTGNASSGDLGSCVDEFASEKDERLGDLSPSVHESASEKNERSEDSSSTTTSSTTSSSRATPSVADSGASDKKNLDGAAERGAATEESDDDARAQDSMEAMADDVDDFSSKHSLEGAESLPEDDQGPRDSGNDWEMKLDGDSEEELGARARRRSEGDVVREARVDPVDQIAKKLAGADIKNDLGAPLQRSSRLVSKEKPAKLRARTSEPPRTLRFAAAPQSPPRSATSGRKRSTSERNDDFGGLPGPSWMSRGSPGTPPRGNRSPLENIGNSPGKRARSIERDPQDLEDKPGPSGTQTRSPNTPPLGTGLPRKRPSPSQRGAADPEENGGPLGIKTRSPVTPPRGIGSPRKRSRSKQRDPDDFEDVASPSKKSPATPPMGLTSPRKRSSPSQGGSQNGEAGTPRMRRKYSPSSAILNTPSDDEATDL